jgi:hypothetical protein
VTWDGLRRDRPFDRLSPMRVKPNNLGGFGRSLGWIGGARRKHEPKPGGGFSVHRFRIGFFSAGCFDSEEVSQLSTHITALIC